MKAFRVRGTFRMGPQAQPFTKEVAAPTQEEAVERVLSLLGSKHRTKRRDIRIDEVKEIGAEEVSDPAVEHLLGVE